MSLTFLAARELRSLSSDPRLKTIWQTADELQNVGISTRLLNILLGDFLNGFDSTEKNVKLDSSVVQSWLLRHQSQMFPVLSNVQLCDLRIIQL